MHLRIFDVTLLLALVACGGPPGGRGSAGPPVAASPERKESPSGDAPSAAASIIDGHLAAYNQRDIEAFMAFFHDEVEIRLLPRDIRTVGKESVAEVYGALFSATESLEATIEKRSEHDGMVVDTERVHFRTKGGERQMMRALAIYQLRDGLIYRLWLIERNE